MFYDPSSPVSLRRLLQSAAAIALIILISGCGGVTTNAGDVSDDSATLHADVSWKKGETASWWFETRPLGGTWKTVSFHGPLKLPTSADHVDLKDRVDGLTAGTDYEYRLCSYIVLANGAMIGSPENPVCVDREAGAPTDHWSQFTTTGTAPDPAPQTTLTSGPHGTITTRETSFSFSSSDPGSVFECRLDDADFQSCESPLLISDLSDGAHYFRVRAIDPNGTADPSPAMRYFTVSAR